MNSRVATISLCGNKNCFLKVPLSWASSLPTDKVIPLKIETEKGAIIYASWQGEISASNQDDVIEINALFASKHRLIDGAKVVVSVLTNIPTCERAFVEPLSVDDWEVLELHASFIESHILDQVRVVWKGQELPIWINSSTCIFVKVESIEPEEACSVLEQMTELYIAPKDRRSLTHGKNPKRSDNDKDQEHTDFRSTLKSVGADKSDSIGSGGDEEALMHVGVLQWLIAVFQSLWFGSSQSKKEAVTTSSNPDTVMKFDFKPEYLPLDRSIISSLRVQPGPRFEPRSDQLKDEGSTVLNKRFQDGTSGLQPTCVYVSESSLRHIIEHPPACKNMYRLPRSFLVAIKPSKSIAEREEVINMKALSKKALGTKSQKGKRNNESGADKLPDDPCKEHGVVVRLVILDIENKFLMRMPCGESATKMKFMEHVLPGHVMVNDLLRRQMMLPVTGRICLMPLLKENRPVSLIGLHLHPLFNKPNGIEPEMMVTAFKSWVSAVTSQANPLVVTNGTLIKISLLPDFSGEFMLTMEQKNPIEKKLWPDYCLLHQEVCDAIRIHVGKKITNAEKPKSITNLPSWNLQEIDPKVPSETRAQLGGVDHIFSELLSHTQSLLQSFPLSSHFMKNYHGMRGGAVLVCGPKGCGKSSFTRAICRSVAERTPLANVTVIDCKPLRGKRVDSIQKQFQSTFSEAAWRKPSVVLLDDLDHIAAAPTGPEQEMSGEAVYFTRVAEVVKEILQREIMENSVIVVIVTSKSQESLHASLTTSRGHQFFQKVVNLKSPDKAARQSILAVLLNQRAGVKVGHLENLNLPSMAEKTEGYVAKDLELLVNRAVHAHRMTLPKYHQRQPVTEDDLLNALEGFTPMGLRNVTLHSGGDVTWQDVGGLKEVKATLVETLLWPSKYPNLFTNCPLRLRQGLLLYGAPGTGKTLLAGAVARECGLNFISIKGPELLSKYIGASEQAVRQTFERAQSAKPCILFFDEFDSLAPRRGHDSTGVTDRVVNQLLTQLDGVEGLQGVYVLAATSRPDLIDPALLRPGRLDKALNCTLPTKEERIEILDALSRSMRLADDVDMSALASVTTFFTGADLKALLYNAQLDSIHESTNLWGSVKIPFEPLREDQEIILPTLEASGFTSKENRTSDSDEKTISRQTASFEYLLPDGGSTSFYGEGRKRNSSSGGSSSSDQSVGQSPSWEVVAVVTEKPRPEGVRAPGERLAYMPNVEEGIAHLTLPQEDNVLAKVNEDFLSHNTYENAKVCEKSVSTIYQRHLISASKKMKPSVSERERLKYDKIYENFSQSKGGDFGRASEVAGQRATLA